MTTLLAGTLAGALSILVDAGYGTTLFLSTPALAGFVAGLRTDTWHATLCAMASTLMIAVMMLIVLGTGETFWILLASPVIVATGLLGALAAKGLRNAMDASSKS